MALSVGVGMALDAKIKKRSNKVYVMIGDGEVMRELYGKPL